MQSSLLEQFCQVKEERGTDGLRADGNNWMWVDVGCVAVSELTLVDHSIDPLCSLVWESRPSSGL